MEAILTPFIDTQQQSDAWQSYKPALKITFQQPTEQLAPDSNANPLFTLVYP